MNAVNRIAPLLLILSAALTYVPVVPLFPAADSEAGWMLGLNTAVARGMVFGRDIVFTFGPYAAVQTTQYNPATARMMLGGAAVVAVALAAGLITLAGGTTRWRAVAAANVVVVLWARDALGITLPLVALLVCGEAARRPGWRPAAALLVLMSGLAMLSLVKESYTAGAVIALGFGLPLLVWRGRRSLALASLALFLAAMAGFWVLAGQPLAALPGYFRAVAPIISGYGQAMSQPTPANEPVICVGAMILVVVLLHLGHARRAGGPGWLLTIGAALLLGLGFKAGFVRGDPNHVVIATDTLLLAAGIVAVVVPWRLAAAAWAIGLAAWGAVLMQLLPVTPLDLAARLPQNWRNTAEGFSGTLAYPEILPLRFEASLADIRARFPLPPIAGPVDIYSYGQAALLAGGLAWAPRPVLQSYSAYTAGLAELDRSHLLGAGRPDTILFRVEPIDGRLPALEDGPSWPVLMSRYAVTSQLGGGEMAVLSRRAPAEPVLGRPLLAGRYGLGTDITLPQGDTLMWAEVDLRPSLLGRLVDAAYKLPASTITLVCQDGQVATYRFVPEMGQGGFLLSPLVRTTADFIAVATQARVACRPKTMRIDAAGWAWPKRFGLRIAPLTLGGGGEAVPAKP